MDNYISVKKPVLNASEIAAAVGGPYPLDKHLSAMLSQGPCLIELAPGKQSIDELSLQKQQELKEKCNATGAKIISVHVSPHLVANLSGLYQNNYLNTEHQLNEIKKAIDLMKNAGHGGAIVVHTAEFPRYNEFKEFDFRDEGIEYLADKKSKTIIPIKDSDIIVLPKYAKNSKNEYEITDSLIQFEKPTTFKEFAKKYASRAEAAYDFLKKIKEVEINQAISQAQLNEYEAVVIEKEIEKLKSAYSFWKEKERSMSDEELLLYSQILKHSNNPFIPGELKKPSEYLEKTLNEAQKRMISYIDSAKHLYANAREAKEHLEKNIVALKEFALQRSIETIAESAMYAIQATNEKQKMQQDFKPIFIAPENVFPEMGFGSHPEELRELIIKSRHYLSKKLQEKGYAKETAEELSKKHIKATLDTEHLGMWKRFFKGNEKEFNEWMLKNIEILAKDEIIGHVHIADGLGRGHANLPAGQGNLPIKQALEIIKKYDTNNNITFLSEGYGDEENSWKGALKELTNEKIADYDKSVRALYSSTLCSSSMQLYVPVLSSASWLGELETNNKIKEIQNYNLRYQ